MALNLMQAVLSEEGTMSVRLKEKDRFPMAGKTGTVQTPTKVLQKWANRKGVRDSWFAGIIPGNVTTVWIGNDQGAPFPGSGAGNSGQVWLKYALSIKYSLGIEEDTLVRPFEGNFTQVDICGDNGFLLSEVQECKHPLYKQYYYKGEEPKGNQAKPEVAPEKLEFKVEEQEEGTVFDDAPEPETHTPPPENKPPEVNKPEESAPEAPKSNF
jgi:membrane peptidoglycan carboxypeptidase